MYRAPCDTSATPFSKQHPALVPSISGDFVLLGQGGCLPQPRWAVGATGAGAHQGQTSREGEKDIWWTAGTTGTWASRTRKHSEAGYGRPGDKGAWTATVKRPRQQPAQPPIRQLLGAADAQTAHPATSSTAPAHQLLGSANAETTPAGAPASAADRMQRPDATCAGKNG